MEIFGHANIFASLKFRMCTTSHSKQNSENKSFSWKKKKLNSGTCLSVQKVANGGFIQNYSVAGLEKSP